MIRLYFDWNAIIGLKNNRPTGLEALLLANKHRFRIFYSTAHIGDIYKGYAPAAGITPEITSDLDYISKLTNDGCFYYDKPSVIPDERHPLDLFTDRIMTEQWANDLLGTFSLPSTPTENALPDTPDNKAPFTGADFITGIAKDPLSATVSLFNGLYTSNLYKDLRKLFQKGLGINRDQMFNTPDPFKKLNTHIAETRLMENTFDAFHQRLAETYNNAPDDWFNNISSRYITLDMAGYKEDEIKIANNKTFKNTIEDAFHTAFASQCDLYVTNDDRNLHKAKAIYESLDINTIVYTPDELLAFLTKYIEQENGRSFFELVLHKINDWKKAGHHPDNEKHVTVFLKDYVLDYFNKAYYVSDLKAPEGEESWMIVLTKEKPTNGRFTLIRDIDTLINKLSSILGEDIENKGNLSAEENAIIQKKFDWPGRSWQFNQLFVKFCSLNGYFQVYLHPVVLKKS